ncbi:MAG: epoxyqueuosine reductase QueH [Clostridia bacterium]|nr:epoxyqueuosine reductase QueH [Clostridia bacterium]
MPENRDRRKYTKETERIFAGFGTEKPTLLLHACCAPCSSYSLEFLAPHFRKIDIWFYNPNITPAAEYGLRLAELKRLVETVRYPCPVEVLDVPYDPSVFFTMAKGMEHLPEGGERCRNCYEQRLRSAAETAKTGGYDWFTTTLSISPYKNAHWLNAIGIRLGEETGVPYLISDFKKNGGYARSIALSAQYGLYRQDWCGCVYSRMAAENA